jgi:adenylosuccinate lyase
MRKYGVEEPYEKLKALTRGKAVSAKSIRAFVATLDGVPEDVKAQMHKWTPATYVGNAAEQAHHVRDHLGACCNSTGPHADT